MLRKFLAFLAYNIYSGCVLWAFDWNTAYRFDSNMVSRLEHTGFDTPPNQWGWGNHYVWRLLAAGVSTLFGGFVAGAVARTRGGIIAAVSNVPSIALWAWIIYILGFENIPTIYGDQEITSHTGMVVISVIAIPLTTLLALLGGQLGADAQRDEFGEEGVLGIAGYHWFWLFLPIYFYTVNCLIPITTFLTFSFLYSDVSILAGIINFIMFLVAVASFIPLGWVYSRLRNPAESFKQSLAGAGINFLILVLGFAFVGAVQYAGQWLLEKMS